MSKLITINLSYYNQPKSILMAHIDNWKSFNNKNIYTFIIIDDGSTIPITEVLKSEDLSDLDIHIYRVTCDLYCNIAGVRNLGLRECKTVWCLILDMDTVVSPTMAKELETIAIHNISNHNVYKFNRIVCNNINHEKNNQIHPAVCLIKKTDYWNIGGCEEDLVGNYGYTDPCFWFRAKNKVSVIEKRNIYLNYYPEGESDINRNTAHNFKIFQTKTKNNNWSNDIIRFNWEKIY